MSNKFDLGELRARNFESNSRNFLVRAHNIMLGYEPEPHETNEVIQARLREASGPIGQAKVEAIKQEIEEKKVIALDTPQNALRRMPNLGCSGKWEGKMRRVCYQKRDPNDAEDAITVAWEEMKIDLVHNRPVDIPYPLYESLKAAKTYKLNRRWEHEKEPGPKEGMLYCIEKVEENPRYRFDDLGDTPGTENKFESYLHLFRDIANKTQIFKGITRTLLVKIYNICFGTTPMTALIGVSDQDLRIKIAAFLGPDYEAMMSEELYGSAVA